MNGAGVVRTITSFDGMDVNALVDPERSSLAIVDKVAQIQAILEALQYGDAGKLCDEQLPVLSKELGTLGAALDLLKQPEPGVGRYPEGGAELELEGATTKGAIESFLGRRSNEGEAFPDQESTTAMIRQIERLRIGLREFVLINPSPPQAG